jgi:preprotein translocase subunit SecB
MTQQTHPHTPQHSANESEASPQNQNTNFIIQKIFTESLSFEAPGTPLTFQGEWKPEANIDLQTQHKNIDPTLYHVTLSVTVTVKNAQKTVFLVEVKQSGLFTITGFENNLPSILGSYCPSTLFPYAREAISSMIHKGGFPEINIAPINFDALYAQTQQSKEGQVIH